MKALKIVLVIVGIALLLVVGIGATLPKDYQVVRRTIIAHPSDLIHPYVNNLERWPEWTPWEKMDESVVTTIGDVSEGVGANQSWTGDQGDGRLVFTKSDPRTGVHYDMFMNGDKWQPKASINYAATDGGTQITWTMQGSVPIPVLGGYLARMMDNMIGTAFEDGLSALKELVETEVAATVGPTPPIDETEPPPAE